jgi:hypothetical protein
MDGASCGSSIACHPGNGIIWVGKKQARNFFSYRFCGDLVKQTLTAGDPRFLSRSPFGENDENH